MASSGADIYLILMRPSRVPVVGEAVSNLFQGQVLLESMSWNLHNEDELKRAAGGHDDFSRVKNLVDRASSAQLRAQHAREDLRRDIARADVERQKLVRSASADEVEAIESEHRKAVDRLLNDFNSTLDDIAGRERARSFEQVRSEARSQQVEEAERNRNFEFTFTKRVDIATTQMLNSMKAGDIFPSGTLTIHKRSATVMDGTSLVFSIQKIRLLDYQLQVVVTDTMTEMMEEWTAEFGALAYVYKNPPSHYSHGNAGQAVAKTLTQGTMRAFTMKNIGSPL
jgi:type VI protein secretion system component Hcp